VFLEVGPGGLLPPLSQIVHSTVGKQRELGGYDRDVRSTPEWDVIEPMVRQQPVGGWEYEGV
jgi:hypothetical protein